MFWEVLVPGDDGVSSKTVTVEAENWFSALRSSLNKHGSGGQLISNLTCNIKPDKSVLVTDFVTRKVFTLKPLDGAPVRGSAASIAPAAPAPPEAREPAAPDAAVEGLPSDLPRCKGFFRRDEAPDDASGIFYRERMLAVAPGTDKESAARLALAVYERLQTMGSIGGTKLFVAVQVFDHEFEGRFERPAIAALEWKEWSPKKARIKFPLSGSEEIRFTRASVPPPGPAPAAEPDPAPIPAPAPIAVRAPVAAPAPVPEPAPIPLIAAAPPRAAAARPSVESVASAPRPAPAQVAAPAAPPQTEAPIDLRAKEPRKKRQTGEGVVLDDVFFQAFERMHEIYSYRDHDKVAEFALKLAQEFIKCEAGSTMLITPGKYELYVAAAQGAVAQSLRGKRLSLTKGIVGFATRAGAVVTVSDPENDPRFHDEFDKETSFKTRNVVCAPIQFEGKTIGAIELLNSARESGFLQSEANVLSYIAGAVGEYIDTSLPSREADFSDKDFERFLPSRKAAAMQTGGAPARPAPAVQARQAEKPAVKATMPEIPAAKKTLPPPAQSGGKHKKKRKR